MSQHFGTDKRQRHLQTSVFSFLLFLLNSPHLSLAVNATAICTHHGCICNFHVFGGNLRHSQGNKSLKQVIQTLNKYIHSVTTNSHTMFICSTLLNHITHKRKLHFVLKESIAADISALVRCPGRVVQTANKQFSQLCTELHSPREL